MMNRIRSKPFDFPYGDWPFAVGQDEASALSGLPHGVVDYEPATIGPQEDVARLSDAEVNAIMDDMPNRGIYIGLRRTQNEE